jgi:hypothetical protein
MGGEMRSRIVFADRSPFSAHFIRIDLSCDLEKAWEHSCPLLMIWFFSFYSMASLWIRTDSAMKILLELR